jgi:fucose 4-O-acetylase-like acetyltransferase
MAKAPDSQARIPWIDAARGIGITLVFLGHFLQSLAPRNATADEAFRFLYSFHVPFFFVLSGLVSSFARTFGAQLRTQAVRLLLPVAFFGIAMGGVDLLRVLRHGIAQVRELEDAAEGYLIGQPDFDWVTWFLVCLFMCRMLGFLAVKVAKGPAQELLLGLALMAAGAYLGNHSQYASDGLAYYIDRFWFLSEAVTALGFFLLSRAARPWLGRPVPSRSAAAALLGGLVLVLLTYGRNKDGGAPVVVMMAAREHGNVFWFMLTALSGSLAMLGLGILVGKSKLLGDLGRNTLPLLGLNGLFFAYVNPLLARSGHIPDTLPGVALASLLVTPLSLAACLPLVWSLNRFLPQLVGKPARAGPWLPPLERQPPAPAAH